MKFFRSSEGISYNIKRAQQEELNEYFYKIKRMGELKKENERLKVHEKQDRIKLFLFYLIP